MSKRTFVSTSATPVFQVWKGTITTFTNGLTYKLIVTDELGGTYTFTHTVVNPPETDATTTAAAFIAQWNADTTPSVQAIVATQLAGQVILTARTAGTPFYVATTTQTGAWAATPSVTTINLGPADFGTVSNWVEGVVPVALDDVTFVSGSLLYGLQQAAVLTGKLTFAATWKGAIGSAGLYMMAVPTSFVDNTSASATTAKWVNVGNAAIALQINSTGAPSSGYGLNILGSALTVVTVASGSVGVALAAGETAGIATLSNLNGTVETGLGVATSISFSQANGTGIVNAGATSITVSAGTVTTQGTGAVTTATVTGTGTFIGNSSGTISTLKRLGGTADFTQSSVARTVTSESYSGGTIKFAPAILTITNSTPLAGLGAIQNTTKAA